jgi:predicted O-methyltransferase YrrM
MLGTYLAGIDFTIVFCNFLIFSANTIMYSKKQLALKYIHYFLNAKNGKGHGIHSPFVFDFTQQVLNKKKLPYSSNEIEDIRQYLKNNQQLIQIEDFGAGSRVIKQNTRKVATVAKSSLKPLKYSALIAKMVNHYKPNIIVELGTSLGITTAYMAKAASNANVYTIEGAPAIAELAKENFEKLGLKNVHPLVGNFDVVLPNLLQQLDTVDFAFIDGNHRFEPTLNYFHLLLPKINEQTIFVFDDIHWSKEMEQAWQYIQNHDAVCATIDLFFVGVVVFKKAFKQKQHFIIRY